MLNKESYIHADILEDNALQQFKDAMNLDCVTKGALMPDAHSGYVLPIGTVIETKGKIFPSFVGYDIGCGVASVLINVKPGELNLDLLKESIIETIPLGKNMFDTDQGDIYMVLCII